MSLSRLRCLFKPPSYNFSSVLYPPTAGFHCFFIASSPQRKAYTLARLEVEIVASVFSALLLFFLLHACTISHPSAVWRLIKIQWSFSTKVSYRDCKGNRNICFNFSSSFPYRKRGRKVLMLHKIFFSRCQFPSFTSCKDQKNQFSREVDVDYMGLAPETGP